jgi:hypothetical protein
VIALFFNLLANSLFSLFCGLVVVNLFLWIFRVPDSPLKLFLLASPFVKILFDLARGIPQESILFAEVDTFALPPKAHTLEAGAGFSKWGPTFQLQFWSKDSAGRRYAESAGDYIALWMKRSLGHGMLTGLLFAIFAVSAFLLARRIWGAVCFERERRRDQAMGSLIRVESIPLRQVKIYLSRGFTGTPFTGGVLRPYICFPIDSWNSFSAEEREAVIQHELGHVRQLDLLATFAVQTLGDLFWFIPGYHLLSRKLDRLREIVADQWAVEKGANPAVLASALLKLKEMPKPPPFALHSAFFRERSLLKLRVEKLLDPSKEKRPRLGWQFRWVRYGLSFWIVAAVMSSTLGGNHPLNQHVPAPQWLKQLVEKLGGETL